MINVEVEGSQSESNSNILRRFSRRVRNAGIVEKARSLQERKRPLSETQKKQEKLRRLQRLEEVDTMIKLGKLPDRRRRS
jgi:ribosomal protein S21